MMLVPVVVMMMMTVTNLAGGRRDCGTMLRPSHIWAISLRQEGRHHDIFKTEWQNQHLINGQ